MKEVKTFFDGTRAKKLEELKKEKERVKKFQSAGSKIIFVNKLLLDAQKKVEKEKNKDKSLIDDKKQINISEENKKKDIFTEKNKGVFEEVKKQKEKETIIDLNQPKFKKLEKFISGKLFIKYLSKSYIIKTIFKDILSFCSNNFHWLCYLVMIINHMMTSSLITLLYPLSIFCYALLEYPRPKKSYWTFCLVYTVILLGLKFLIHLQLFKYIKISDKYMNEYMTELYRKKIGFKTFESSFSTDFFKYILYDALVVIFILINGEIL